MDFSEKALTRHRTNVQHILYIESIQNVLYEV